MTPKKVSSRIEKSFHPKDEEAAGHSFLTIYNIIALGNTVKESAGTSRRLGHSAKCLEPDSLVVKLCRTYVA
jgi:hypothetical protein